MAARGSVHATSDSDAAILKLAGCRVVLVGRPASDCESSGLTDHQQFDRRHSLLDQHLPHLNGESASIHCFRPPRLLAITAVAGTTAVHGRDGLRLRSDGA